MDDSPSLRRSTRRPKEEFNKKQKTLIEAQLRSSVDHNMGIEICQIEKKGRGVLAKRDFRAGEFIVEYAGMVSS